jgi:S-adenosylmethionine synthetase
MCDRISDTILDLYLTQDPNSRCAIETCGGNGKVFVTGEVTSTADITEDDIKLVVYNISGVEDTIVHLTKQSPEIANGVDTGGAGDQGIMIGYACRDNEQFLPQEYFLSRELNKHVFSKYPYDGKTQVTMNGNSLRVVCSFQNAPADKLQQLVMEYFEDYSDYFIESLHCNPAGDWNIGGFTADAGLTGRKLAVDNYGPRVPLGGGAFSGKDCTKVDRSAAYMGRRIAVDILEERPEVQEVMVQLAYAIGYDKPLQATAIVDGEHEFIKGYDLSPKGIIDFLELKRPIFGESAAFGHMGAGFSWK